jgi:hypothetical protein
MKLTRERDDHRLREYGSRTSLSSQKDATVFFDDYLTDGKRAGRTEIDDLSLKNRRNQIGWTVAQTCERVSTQVHQMR